MRLEVTDNNRTKYIRIVENVSVKDPETGKRFSRKRTIKNIGPVSRFDDGKPDFIERLLASFKACDPIIEELRPYATKELPKEIYNIKLFQDSEYCVAEPKLCSSLLFEKLLKELEIDQLIRTYKNRYNVDYDVFGFIKALLFGRILNPASKISTIAQNSDYFEPLIKNDFNEYDVYHTLDFIFKHKNALFNRINNAMTKKFGRTTNHIYYDVTNFFFETDKQDEENGRVNGVSKEKQKKPIVQMGLLMDEQGFPISIETFPGNTLDHQTLQASFDNLASSIQGSRYIYVCDKGIGKGDNLGYAIANGNGYLTSKSVRGSNKLEKEWIRNQDGYIFVNDNFKYKSKIITKEVAAPDGSKIKTSEKVLTYWSRSYFEREKAEKKSFYDMIEKIIASPENFRITKTQSPLLKKYLKKEFVNIKTGEIADSNNLAALLDMDKIKAEYELLGYYTIVTSETNMPEDEMLSIYKNLVEIEDQFRVMKSTLDTKPIFVRTKDHVTAHLVICAISLIMIRLIQRQIKTKHPELINPDNLFNAGLSADRIQAALNKWQVEKLDDVYYRFCNLNNCDLALILDSMGLNIPHKCFKIGELKHLKALMELSM